jgi:hypothetical protein
VSTNSAAVWIVRFLKVLSATHSFLSLSLSLSFSTTGKKVQQALREKKWVSPVAESSPAPANRGASAKKPAVPKRAAAIKKKAEEEEVEIVELSEVIDQDVLSGRGNRIAQHPGNQLFRQYCWEVRHDYYNAVRNEKGAVAERVMDQIYSIGGRFLDPVFGTDGAVIHYVRMKEDLVREKTSQALRDKKWSPSRMKSNTDAILARRQQLEKQLKKKKTTTTTKIPPPKKAKNIKKKTAVVVKPTLVKEPSPAAKLATTTTTKPKPTGQLLEDMKQRKKRAEMVQDQIRGGARLKVWWALDNRYYKATVLEQGSSPTQVHIRYDDEATEWIDLADHQFMILNDEEKFAAKVKRENSEPDPYHYY